MVTRNEAFPSRFFKAADITEEGLPLKIAKVEQEKVGTDQELKWVLLQGSRQAASPERHQLGPYRSRPARRGQRQLDRQNDRVVPDANSIWEEDGRLHSCASLPAGGTSSVGAARESCAGR